MKKQAGVAIILACLLTVQVCLAAIAVDTSGAHTDGMSSATQTVALTVASHTDKIMLGGFGVLANAPSPSAFTYNGDNLSSIMGAAVGDSSGSAGIWYRLEPDVGVAQNLVVTQGTTERGFVCGLALYNVLQATPLRDQGSGNLGQNATGTATTTSDLTMVTAVGDVVFYNVHAWCFGCDPVSATPNVGTEIAEVYPDSGAGGQTIGSCGYVVASGSTTVIHYTFGNSSRYRLTAVVVEPDPSAQGGTLNLMGVGH